MSKWWKNAIIYQIYPRSFKDSNNDGIGDLKGITEKLDYLKDLGIDAIWLSPVYASPMEDNGYDVSDYFDIAPEFGTMKDMETLIKEAKKRNIRILMDLVANHTSKEHIWFKKALQGDPVYHDFFYWSKKSDDKRASFGGSSWEYVPELKEYYYHYFAKGQVDINWTNPRARKEVANIVNFWLDKGVAGFRMDAIELIGKELDKDIYANGPMIHDYLRELNENSFGRYKDAVTVGEGWPTPEIAIEYTSPRHHEVNMMFNFECISLVWRDPVLGKFNPTKPSGKELATVFNKWQTKLYNRGWNTLFFENHDLARSINNMGSEKYRVESAKALAYILYMQQGTPYIFQGQEIGMTNAHFTKLSDYQDIDSIGQYEEHVNFKKDVSSERMIQALADGSRDNARTPMQWDGSINAGFNKGAKTWLAVNKNYQEINVDEEKKNPNSIFNEYKKLIALRKSKEWIKVIEKAPYVNLIDHNDVIAYSRIYKDKGLAVICNMSEKENTVSINLNVKKVLLSNYNNAKTSLKNIKLRPYEAMVVEVK